MNLFGGNDGVVVHHSRPRVSLADLDNRLSFLQANALDRSTTRGYAVGARDYLRFCLQHHLPFDPTPLTLARYIAYTSQFIASGPSYLSGSRPLFVVHEKFAQILFGGNFLFDLHIYKLSFLYLFNLNPTMICSLSPSFHVPFMLVIESVNLCLRPVLFSTGEKLSSERHCAFLAPGLSTAFLFIRGILFAKDQTSFSPLRMSPIQFSCFVFTLSFVIIITALVHLSFFVKMVITLLEIGLIKGFSQW